jgi:ferrous iron transport protein A
MDCSNDNRKTLCDLDIGKTGVVAQIEAEPPLKRRILEMGLVPGTEVRMERKAPLNDPVLIYLRGYELSLRLEEAHHVILVSERSSLCGKCKICID